MPSPRRVSLLGLPGSGKTTIARALADRLGWHFFSVGEALRIQAARDAPLREALAAGQLASEEIVFRLTQAAVNSAADSGLVIDGFPRHVGQLEAADRLFGSWQPIVLQLAIPTAATRAKSRTAIGRPEDLPDVVDTRLRIAAPLLDGLLSELERRTAATVYVDASVEPSATLEAVLAALI